LAVVVVVVPVAAADVKVVVVRLIWTGDPDAIDGGGGLLLSFPMRRALSRRVLEIFKIG
jgi:hypothetical protein